MAVERIEDALIAAVFVAAAVVADFGFVAPMGPIAQVLGLPEALDVFEIQQLRVAALHSTVGEV